MTSKHTPGPWHAVQLANYWNLQAEPSCESVNLLSEDPDPELWTGEAEANAKLAAAAPELLEACELLMSQISEGLTQVFEEEADNGQPAISACDMIEKAINKAKGIE